MANLLLPIVVIAALAFAIQVAIVRWLLRVNTMVNLLRSIDESLKFLPAVRQAEARGERHYAA